MSDMNAQVLAALAGIKGGFEGMNDRIDAIQKQADAIDLKNTQRHLGGGGSGGLDIAGLVQKLADDPGFIALKENGRGRAIVKVPNLFEVKTLLSSDVGTAIPYSHESGIAMPLGRARYGRVRRMMRSTPIDTGVVHYAKETVHTNNASPQVEGADKSESIYDFDGATVEVKTFAHWTRTSQQILADFHELGEHIRTALIYGLEKKFEEELLHGDGTGVHFEGIATTATAFDTAILALLASDGYNRADCLRAAALQLEEAGHECTAFITSPRDWFLLETEKDAERRYLHGSSRGEMAESLWTRPIVPSHAMSAGTFLAGDFETGAHIRMRMESVVAASTEDGDNFRKNVVTLLGEMRAALVVKKPGAFVEGSYATSPA